MYVIMQVTKWSSMQVCKLQDSLMLECKFAGMYVWKSMQICKVASMKICKYVSMRVCKN